MPRLSVFNQQSLDGYFIDASGDMSWAHNTRPDPEWAAFVSGNAQGGGRLVFGRKTYEMMAGYWPTPAARQSNPVVAEQMNKLSKVVFSRTMDEASWSNTLLLKGDLADDVRRLKAEPGADMVIMGSGSIVSQLTQARLIDEYQVVVTPLIIGAGRTMFEGVQDRLNLRLTQTRSFANGNVVLHYQPMT